VTVASSPFRIVKQPRAWWPVVWSGVAEDGTLVDNRIELRFRILKVDAAAGFMRDVVETTQREVEADVNLPDLYAGLVERIADDWRHVAAENGEVLPWTPENLRLLMNEGGMFRTIFRAWQACLAGERDRHEGN
jgi:hypothetical protein